MFGFVLNDQRITSIPVFVCLLVSSPSLQQQHHRDKTEKKKEG